MKKYIKHIFVFLAAIMFFSPVKTNGQAAILALIFGDKVASQNFYFSLKIGGGINNITNWDNSKFKFGMNFGLMGSIKLNEKFSLVPELNFVSEKGARNIPKVPSGNSDLDNVLEDVNNGSIDLSYIDLPVLLKYYSSTTFYFGGGFYLSYLTDASDFYSTNLTGAGDIEVRQFNTDDFNRWDFGVMAEVGYAPHRTSNSDDMNFHLRISYGFVDILKDNSGKAVNNYSIQGFISIPFMKKDK